MIIIVYSILILLASVGLVFFILIQNPKGGGLADSIGGVTNNFMGVKQTTDVLEKGTWILISVIVVLALSSNIFLKEKAKSNDTILQNINTSTLPSQK
ncbi:MAG: preprotein translocase subunit SecG [Alphaproteobacteria bacterium]|nr:preprotein translocase subunit SecG [Alphaproteobacteria bacterium]